MTKKTKKQTKKRTKKQIEFEKLMKEAKELGGRLYREGKLKPFDRE